MASVLDKINKLSEFIVYVIWIHSTKEDVSFRCDPLFWYRLPADKVSSFSIKVGEQLHFCYLIYCSWKSKQADQPAGPGEETRLIIRNFMSVFGNIAPNRPT